MPVTEKQKAIRIIEEQPEDSSYEDIVRELGVRAHGRAQLGGLGCLPDEEHRKT